MNHTEPKIPHRGKLASPDMKDWNNLRRWLYGLAIPIMGLLITYGIIGADTAPLWLAVIGTTLGPIGAEASIAKAKGRGRATKRAEVLAAAIARAMPEAVADTIRTADPPPADPVDPTRLSDRLTHGVTAQFSPDWIDTTGDTDNADRPSDDS